MDNAFPTPASSDDQNNPDSEQIDKDKTLQVTNEAALQKSNKELTKPSNSQLRSYNESREIGRQQLNKTITNYAQTAMRPGKKRSAT